MEQTKKTFVDKTKIEKTELTVDGKFTIEQGKEIAKVLSIDGKAYILDESIKVGEYTLKGKMCFELIYLSENGNIYSQNSCSEFESIIKSDKINENTIIEPFIKVVDITMPSVKTNEVKVGSILNIEGYIINLKEISSFVPDDDIMVKYKTKNYFEYIGKLSQKVNLDNEVKIKGELNNIIGINSSLIVKDCFCGNDFATVSGDIVYNILYNASADKLDLRQITESVPYKQEFELQGATTETKCTANVLLIMDEIKVSVVQEDNYNTIKITTPLLFRIFAYNEKSYDDVEDMFSLSYDLKENKEEISYLNKIDELSFTETITNKTTLNPDKINYLGYYSPNNVITNVKYDDNSINIEGVISLNVFYNKEDSEEIFSNTIEIPYATTEKNTNGLKENVNIVSTIEDISVKQNGDNELEVTSKMNYELTSFNSEVNNMLLSATKVGDKVLDDSALTILIGKKGDTLWDLSKRLNISTDEILFQNKDLKEPLTGGERIIIYRQKIVKFEEK
jgi:hypothetical protein